jgi:hypothetical protein
MRQRIVRIGKLVKDDPSPACCMRYASSMAPAWNLFRCQNHLGTIGAHGLHPFGTGAFRHQQNHLVAHHRRRHGQRDTGIATGRFDQGIARFDIATRLGPADHRQRWPVLRPDCCLPT